MSRIIVDELVTRLTLENSPNNDKAIKDYTRNLKRIDALNKATAPGIKGGRIPGPKYGGALAYAGINETLSMGHALAYKGASIKQRASLSTDLTERMHLPSLGASSRMLRAFGLKTRLAGFGAFGTAAGVVAGSLFALHKAIQRQVKNAQLSDEASRKDLAPSTFLKMNKLAEKGGMSRDEFFSQIQKYRDITGQQKLNAKDALNQLGGSFFDKTAKQREAEAKRLGLSVEFADLFNRRKDRIKDILTEKPRDTSELNKQAEKYEQTIERLSLTTEKFTSVLNGVLVKLSHSVLGGLAKGATWVMENSMAGADFISKKAAESWEVLKKIGNGPHPETGKKIDWLGLNAKADASKIQKMEEDGSRELIEDRSEVERLKVAQWARSVAAQQQQQSGGNNFNITINGDNKTAKEIADEIISAFDARTKMPLYSGVN